MWPPLERDLIEAAAERIQDLERPEPEPAAGLSSPIGNDAWDALNKVTGNRRPRGRVVTLDQYRAGVPREEVTTSARD